MSIKEKQISSFRWRGKVLFSLFKAPFSFQTESEVKASLKKLFALELLLKLTKNFKTRIKLKLL